MHVVIALDHLGGTLTSAAAAAALAAPWERRGHTVDPVAMSDGSVAFVDAVHAARGGTLTPVVVTGPSGGRVPASVLHVGTTAGGTAYVETSGVLQVREGDDARELVRRGSSAGVAELLAAALATGARRVVVGVGAAATHDGGAGLLAGLARVLTAADAVEDPLAHLAPVRDALRGVELVVAAATDLPLLGLHGAGAALGTRPGLDPALAQDAEVRVGAFAAAAEAAAARLAPPRQDLLAGAPSAGARASRQPSSGAGGGVAFALSLLGARVLGGAAVVAAEVGLPRRLAGADLAVTGGASLDGDAMHVGVVAAVGRLGLEVGLPVVALAHEVHVTRNELAEAGLSGAYPIRDVRLTPTAAPAPEVDDLTALETRAERLARTWAR